MVLEGLVGTKQNGVKGVYMVPLLLRGVKCLSTVHECYLSVSSSNDNNE